MARLRAAGAIMLGKTNLPELSLERMRRVQPERVGGLSEREIEVLRLVVSRSLKDIFPSMIQCCASFPMKCPVE